MKLEDLLALTSTPRNGDEMLNALKTFPLADDLTDNEKAALTVGFTIGAAYVLAKVQEGCTEVAAAQLLTLMQQWQVWWMET